MPDHPTNPLARVLLIGCNGMLGRAWSRLLAARSIPFTPLDLPRFDLRDESAPRDALTRESYSHAINCAAWTDVDGAETDEPAALALNAAAVASLARACSDTDTALVHYSTDYVFPGDASGPYSVDAPTAPLGAYGRTKLAGEHAVADAAGPTLIVRTSWLYAPWGNNFVRTMLRLFAERDEIKVVDDQTGTPTSATHLAHATLALLQRGVLGTHHITDGGACTWHALAAEIARLAGASCTITPCTTDDFPRPAPRPRYSVLDVSETERLLGPMPGWQTNLAPVVKELLMNPPDDTHATPGGGS